MLPIAGCREDSWNRRMASPARQKKNASPSGKALDGMSAGRADQGAGRPAVRTLPKSPDAEPLLAIPQLAVPQMALLADIMPLEPPKAGGRLACLY